MVYPNYIVANNVVDHEIMERGWRDMSPTCPRCGSSNTKFCYYNNYSLTQPRYFCKGCRRYWTKGGSLRNVPFGGGCRKSRRSRSSSTLRLTTSSNHHHHGITSRNMAMHANHHHQHHHHHEHGNMINNNNNMGDPTTSCEAPIIDLAVVYSNFLNQKPPQNNSNPPQVVVDVSSIPDATTITPTFVDNNDNNNNPTSFSQTLTIMPELIMNINHDHHHRHHHHHDHDQVLFVTEFSRPNVSSSIQHDELIGLPPLPGEESFMLHDHHHQPLLPWAVSDLDHDHDHQDQQQHQHDVNNNLEVALKGEMESSDSQFSSIFINGGNWSPLDLPAFETTSFSSKP